MTDQAQPNQDPSEVKEIKSLDDVQFDPRNPNNGTDRGRTMVKRSIEELKTGRSTLIGSDGILIAGEKTTRAFIEAGGKPEDIIVVPNDGTKLVVVQRTDIDSNDPRARMLAHVDNLSGHVGYNPNAEIIADMETDLIDGGWMTVEEVEDLTASNEGMIMDVEETDAFHRPNPFAARAEQYAERLRQQEQGGAPALDGANAAEEGKLPSGRIDEEPLPPLPEGTSAAMQAAMAAATSQPAAAKTPAAPGATPQADAGTRLVQMYFTAEDYEAFLADIKLLAGRYQTKNITDTVVAAVRECRSNTHT